eukprot:7384125-Prymnesium_polylepis.1
MWQLPRRHVAIATRRRGNCQSKAILSRLLPNETAELARPTSSPCTQPRTRRRRSARCGTPDPPRYGGRSRQPEGRPRCTDAAPKEARIHTGSRRADQGRLLRKPPDRERPRR